MLFLLITCTKA